MTADLTDPVRSGPDPEPGLTPFPRPDVGAASSLATGAVGHSRALSVLSPLPRRWSWLLGVALRYKRWKGPDPVLQGLSLIHMAHWVIIDRLPGQRRRSRYAYLLFVSNFNGSWREYIDAFSTAIPGRMALLWGTSYGFPGARPPLPFVRYIETTQLPPEHYYAAYPEATATEVASALRVAEQFEREIAPARSLDDQQFARIWRRFVDQAQRDL